MIVDDGAVERNQIQATSAICVFKIWRVEELENGVQRDLILLVLEGRRALRDLEQENISFFIGVLGIVRAMQSVHDNVFPVLASEAVGVLFGHFRLLVTKKLFPARDWHVKLDLFYAFGVVGVRDLVDLVDEQHDNRLSCHHVLLDVGVVGSVSVRIKQVEHLFASENLAFLVEDLKVIFLKIFIKLVDLETIRQGLGLPIFAEERGGA